MTNEQMRIAVNVHRGWHYINYGGIVPLGIPPSIRSSAAMYLTQLPPVDSDLNAVAELVNALPSEDRIIFLHHLDLITLERSKEWFPARIVTSTPAEYCLALIRLWGIKED